MPRWLSIAVPVTWSLACAGPTPSAVEDVLPAAPAAPAAPATPAPAAPSGDPADPVRKIYAGYLGTGAEWLPYASTGLVRDWAAAVATAEKNGCGMAPIHESDVIVDGQDVELGNVVVDAETTGERALARARFENFGAPKEVRFDLVFENGSWRIDDVHPTGPSLREQIRATIENDDTDC